MKILLHPTYFPSIAHFVAMVQADTVIFEVEDNYQKQTYRNRCHIYGANGRLSLNIPVHHTHNNRQLYRDVKISNDSKWQLQHWKSLQSAYRTSPFYEYYEDDLAPLFHDRYEFLMDFNFACLDIVLDCLQFEITYQKTQIFEKESTLAIDARSLVNARKEQQFELLPYTQVFSNKHGFISNLSILDLLCNEGTTSLNYLETQNLDFE